MHKDLSVYVYRNLNKNTFSIKSIESGRVIAYADNLLVKDAKFSVSESGRKRVIREQVRNVHAGVKGTLVIDPKQFPDKLPSTPVYYNPYKVDKFTSNGIPLEDAKLVYFENGKVFI